MRNGIKNLLRLFFRKKISHYKKGWVKIEDKSDGPVSWTEYTDHNGYVYTIYNIMSDPGFSGAVNANWRLGA